MKSRRSLIKQTLNEFNLNDDDHTIDRVIALTANINCITDNDIRIGLDYDTLEEIEFHLNALKGFSKESFKKIKNAVNSI